MADSNVGSFLCTGYETTFITGPELSDDGLKVIQDRLLQVILQYKGEVVLTEDWGKRKLAYPIQKEVRGHYSYLVYTGEGDVVHEIERSLRLNEHVLRYLTVQIKEKLDPDAFRAYRAQVHLSAKQREEEREARREERGDRYGGYRGGGYEEDSGDESYR